VLALLFANATTTFRKSYRRRKYGHELFLVPRCHLAGSLNVQSSITLETQ